MAMVVEIPEQCQEAECIYRIFFAKNAQMAFYLRSDGRGRPKQLMIQSAVIAFGGKGIAVDMGL